MQSIAGCNILADEFVKPDALWSLMLSWLCCLFNSSAFTGQFEICKRVQFVSPSLDLEFLLWHSVPTPFQIQWWSERLENLATDQSWATIFPTMTNQQSHQSHAPDWNNEQEESVATDRLPPQSAVTYDIENGNSNLNSSKQTISLEQQIVFLMTKLYRCVKTHVWWWNWNYKLRYLL